MRKGYDFFSFFVIPALTLLLAAGYELTETNFSVIGNREGRRGLFLLWGAAAGNYFYLYVKELIEFGGCRDRLLTVCLFLSFTFFLCGVGLPYLPGKVPVLSKLHVWASFLGPFFLFCSRRYRMSIRQSASGRNTVRHFPLHRISALPRHTASAVIYCSSDTRIPVEQIVLINRYSRSLCFCLAAFKSLYD